MKKTMVLLLSIMLISMFGVFGCGKKQTIKPIEEPKVEDVTDEDTEVISEDEYAREKKYSESSELNDIYFDLDKYNIGSEDKEILKKNASWIKANKGAFVQIEGHCDERGTTEYNLALGQKRATSARNYLINLGVNPKIISTISYGEERPVDSRSDEDAWAKNRRAHFLVQLP